MGPLYSGFVFMFRIGSFIPLCFSTAKDFQLWKELRKHAIPPGVSWGRSLTVGLELPAIVGLCASIWCLPMLLASTRPANPYWVLPCALIDGTVGTIFWVSTGFLSDVLPATSSKCVSVVQDSLESGYSNVFNFTGSIYEKSAKSVCVDLVDARNLAIVTAVFCTLVTLIEASYSIRQLYKGKYLFAKSPGPFWPILWLLRFLRASFQFAIGYVRKRSHRASEPKRTTRSGTDKVTQAFVLDTDKDGHCHRTDCTEASGGTNLNVECWSCAILTCSRCVKIRKLPESRLKTHLDFCMPRCSRCHFRAIMVNEITAGSKSKSRTPTRANLFCTHTQEEGKMAVQTSLIEAEICAPCGELPEPEIVKIREQRETDELFHLGSSRLICCGECETPLRDHSGVRWWWCTAQTGGCERQCLSNVHPGWWSLESRSHSTGDNGSEV